MGLECPVIIILISCLCLVGQTAGIYGGNDKSPKKGADRCQEWEKDLRDNLTDPGNITEYLKSLNESISNLSPGCVRSFSLNVSLSTLMELMEFLNMKYNILNPGTRKQIYKWVEGVYTETPGHCGMGHQNMSKPKPNGKQPGKPGKDKDKGKGKGSWITLHVLNILGRFIVQAPISALKSIADGKNSTICQLFNTSSDLLDKLYDLTPVQARIFLNGLNKCVNISNEEVISNLGQLVCFYPFKQLESLDKKVVQVLRKELLKCRRNLKMIYQMLVKNIKANTLTTKGLLDLGASVVGLKVSQVSNLTDQAVAGAVEKLKKIKGWSKGQIKALVKKYQKVENVTADKLKNLGVLVSGVDAKTFDKFKGQDLLNAFSQEDVAESSNAMLPVQKNSIMKRILQSVKIDSVLKSLPASLVSQIPIDKLKKADIINLDFLSQNKPWNKGQSVVLINRVKDQLNDVKNISKLKAVVKGIPCDLINSLNPDVAKALANNPLVSSNQIRCFSIKFFKKQKASRPNYFSNLTLEDINEFLVSYMIFQPDIKELKLIPRSLCSNMLQLITQVNITLLPRSSSRRKELLDYATNCLNLTASSMTKDQGNSLGSLVCAFSTEEIKNLNNTVFLEIVDQLRECGRFDGEKKKALREKILSAYPPLSNWTVDELIQLQGLLAVLQPDDFKLIPNSDDIKIALEEILSSRKSAENFIPPDFDNSANFSALYQKLFNILNNKSESSRRRRATDCTESPTLEKIEILGEANNLWTADQLRCISVEDFINSLDILTEVTGFNNDQLTALKEKALEAYGMNITNDQLASLKMITLGFSDEEVKKYFTKPDIDTIGAISDYKEWASNEYSSRAKTIVQNFLDGREGSTLSSIDLVGMGYFLCTLSSDQIKNISVTAYSSAARDIGNKMCPNIETLTALKEKAVQAFSDVKNWTGAQLQEIGVVAAGLSAEEVPQLMTSAVSFLTPEAVSQFPPNVFSAMTIEQLRNLGPQNYGAVTQAQRDALSKEKLEALNENAGNARVIGGAGSIYWNPVMMLTLLVLGLTAALH
ncbi:otoancorin-like [Heptranchias perlo]|uniref:otoancorin-like n=1 Tax=Heptranchias perlo TaxID=212740 RepID=UPI00355A48A3